MTTLCSNKQISILQGSKRTKLPSGSLSTTILLSSLKPLHLSSNYHDWKTHQKTAFISIINQLTSQQLENLRYFRVRCKFQHRSRACWMTIRIKISSEDVGPQEWAGRFVRQVPGNPNSQIRFFQASLRLPEMYTSIQHAPSKHFERNNYRKGI